MLWLTFVLACGEAPPPAQPSAPAVSSRAAFHAPIDARLAFADIEPVPSEVPEAALATVPITLEETVAMSADQRARLRQGICGGDPAVLGAVTEAWTTSTVDTRFLLQPWADVVGDCASPRSCHWAMQQPEGRLRDLAHTVSARCPSNGSSPWWLDPEAPNLAVIRHYQPPNAGTDRWRVPFHVRWSRALDQRITQFGAQAGSDPDIATGIHRLARHPDPQARAAAERLHARLAPGAYELPPPDLASRDPHGCPRTQNGLTPAQRATPDAVTLLEKCWLSMLREKRALATLESSGLVNKTEHGSDLIASDAKALSQFSSSAKLADDLRGVGLIDTLTIVPDGTAWATPEQMLQQLGYIAVLPTRLENWPRGLDLTLGGLVALPGSEIAGTLFLEEEDGVIQAFADGRRWEVTSLDNNGVVDGVAITGFLNTIARDRGHETRFVLLEGGHQLIAAPARGLDKAHTHSWLPLELQPPAPRTAP